jgi:hypothetical protein
MGSAPKEATVRCIATVLLRHMAAHKRAGGVGAALRQRKYNVFDDSPEVHSEGKEQDQEGRTHARSNIRDGRSVLRGSPPSEQAAGTRERVGEGVVAKHDGAAGGGQRSEKEAFRVTRGMPSVNRIREFVDYVYTKAQLEIDGLIIAFIYLERLLARASRDGVNLLFEKNWRTLCFVSLMLASKIWDDFSMDNAVSLICLSPPQPTPPSSHHPTLSRYCIYLTTFLVIHPTSTLGFRYRMETDDIAAC